MCCEFWQYVHKGPPGSQPMYFNGSSHEVLLAYGENHMGNKRLGSLYIYVVDTYFIVRPSDTHRD